MRNLAFILVAAALCGCASAPKWNAQEFAFSIPEGARATTVQTNIVALTRVSVSPLFQARAFTYKVGDNSYQQDPYAGFAVAPERAVADAVRGWMRQSGAFGHIADPGSGLAPGIVAEMSVTELYGDFRKGTQPVATMKIHCIIYEIKEGSPGAILLDRTFAQQTALAKKTPAALMAAWNTNLEKILEEFRTEYSKTRAPGQ